MKYKKNMRLINANDLRTKLESLTGQFTEDGFLVSLDAVLGIVDFAKGVDAEPVRRWISVKDRLPENAEPVLVICDGHYMMASYGYTKTFGVNWYAATNGVETILIDPNDITHWFQLPKKPKDISKETSHD